ncbi:MAG TPA: sigma-54 dependent transcriptional regulator [Acidobacteriaceae bacterium]|nr:sigma-54 dependent transcriptional regulator [Acidobacteriaceae bacterium]
MIRIALYSEDRKLQQLLSSALGKEFQITLEPAEEEIHQLFSAGECDVVVLDLDSNQASLQERIACSGRIVGSKVSPVVLADDGLRSTALELVRQGAHSYCRKPPSIVELKAMLRRAHESRSLKRKLEAVQHQLEAVNSCDRLIGSSPQIRQVYELVRRVANVNTSVLVTGESGTGKELTARAIHNLGNRADQPFVAVSCGAIPETLIEAELFGHEKGAFTGTVGLRQGYLEQAGSGTLFLDEIGELSLSTQVKLLRVLQEREFNRLGSTRLIPLRARVVFATHQNLAEMVAQGTFRQDLYYRINVMRIDIPPLQEHPEDIPLIARHFLRHYSEMHEKDIEEIDPEAMCLLQAYSWPGNARELENVIQRAIIVARDNIIRPEDLPEDLQEESVVNIADYRSTGSFERQLHDYKIKLATAAVRENQGNKTMAARSLQISRAYLHRLIRLAEEDSLQVRGGQEVGTA